MNLTHYTLYELLKMSGCFILTECCFCRFRSCFSGFSVKRVVLIVDFSSMRGPFFGEFSKDCKQNLFYVFLNLFFGWKLLSINTALFRILIQARSR